MRTAPARAKINLALVVGPMRPDGKHELLTVYERLALADTVELEAGRELEVKGFAEDTLVGTALRALAGRARVAATWMVTIDKRIPVAAGLGGGSSDAATALALANETLEAPLAQARLREIAAAVGSDVPFFLSRGPQLGAGDGSCLTALELPREYHVVVLLPKGATKTSTQAVYGAFDARRGEKGFERRRSVLLEVVDRIRTPADLASLPKNDLASSPLTAELERLGAFRADVSGAGPAVYGLFDDATEARSAASELASAGRTWVTAPAWYG